MYEGHTVQDAIRWAVRQRNLAMDKGFKDVAAFWQNELDMLRARVPAEQVRA
jgi:hypothetical protein